MHALPKAFQYPPLGRQLAAALAPPPWFFLFYNYLCISCLLYHTASSLELGLSFTHLCIPPDPHPGPHTFAGRKAGEGISRPHPTPLLPLPEGGLSKPPSQDGTACLVHLGGLWWPPVQGSSYLIRLVFIERVTHSSPSR